MGRNYALNMPQIKQAAQLYRIGMSRRQVAAHFNVSERAVTSALRYVGQPLRERKYAAAFALSKDPFKHVADSRSQTTKSDPK
jgi:transposase